MLAVSRATSHRSADVAETDVRHDHCQEGVADGRAFADRRMSRPNRLISHRWGACPDDTSIIYSNRASGFVFFIQGSLQFRVQ